MSQQNKTIELDAVKISPKRIDEFRTAYAKSIDILHTDLEVSFNWGKHELLGKETILLKSYFYETDSIILDAKNMSFGEITILDHEKQPIQFLSTYDKKCLRLGLEKKINSQDTITISIRYVAKPDEVEDNNGKLNKNNRGLYFINTDNSEPNKPIQIWTQGEVEANSCWFPTIDKPNEKFTVKLAITVNKDFTTLSNGELVLTQVNGISKTDTWESKKPMPAYLVMMCVGDFKVTKDYLTNTTIDSFLQTTYDTIRLTANDSAHTSRDSIIVHSKMSFRNTTHDLLNGVEVSYYLEPAYHPYALNIFKHTPEMIDFFGGKLGVDYPWNKYAQIIVHDFVAGAMENTSATVHNEYVQKNNRELLDKTNDDIISHELFHQWFGDLATCESWSHLVLNEGFASYGEYLWIEYKYGLNDALQKLYNTHNRYIAYANDVNDDPIVQFNYKDPDDMFSTITYQKGSLVLHQLRSIIGDEAFFLGLKNYLTHFAFQNTEIDDLRREFELVTGQDLRSFFQQWFYKGGHPIIELRYDYNDSTKLLGVTVEQKQSREIGLFKFPLKFKVTQGKQTKFFSFQIDKRLETFYVQKFDTSSKEYPNVFVDPEATFIGEIKDNKPFINHIHSYYAATNYIEKVRSLKALTIIQTNIDTARIVLLEAINDPNPDIRAKAIEWTNWSDIRNVNTAKQVIINMARNDPSAQVRVKASQVVANFKDGSLFNLCMDLAHDSSYAVAAAGLQGLYNLIPDEALRMCPLLEKDAKSDLFAKIAKLYANDGKAENASFFETKLFNVFGRQRCSLMEDYTAFCIRVNQETTSDRAIKLLVDRAINDKNPQVRAVAIASLNDFYLKQQSDASSQKDNTVRNEKLLAAVSFKERIQGFIDQERDEDAIRLLKQKGLTSSQEINEDK